jgi:hypothetical protein
MSASQMGNTNSNSKNNPNSIKIQVTDIETNITTIYNSIGEAARAIGVQQGSISVYLAANRPGPYKRRYLLEKVS